MDIREARQLASETAVWYHQNNIGNTINQRIAAPGKNPSFSDEIWARLMAEAILSFSDGLESRVDHCGGRVAVKKLFDKANNIVGPEAFQTIAMVVSAAETRRPIEEEVDVALQETDQPSTQQSFVDSQTFMPAVDLSGYLVNDADRQVYGQFSSWLMQMTSQPITQGAMHKATKFLQDLAKTPGLSQGFSYVLSSMGTEYQMLADKYTRQSGEGQFQGGDLPTGIQVQGNRSTIADFVVEAFRRVEARMGI